MVRTQPGQKAGTTLTHSTTAEVVEHALLTLCTSGLLTADTTRPGPRDPSAALAAHTRSMIAFGLQSFARLQSSAQPPCLQTELLLYYSHRREQPGPLPYQFGLPPWSLPACWLPGFLQSMATGGWKVRRRLWLPCCCQR